MDTNVDLNNLMWLTRMAEILEEERASGDTPPGWLWWLSYVDPDRSAPAGQQVPGGPGFIGVVVLAAPGPFHAMARASELRLNPGGEVKAFPVPEEHVPEGFRNRLLGRAELAELGSL